MSSRIVLAVITGLAVIEISDIYVTNERYKKQSERNIGLINKVNQTFPSTDKWRDRELPKQQKCQHMTFYESFWSTGPPNIDLKPLQSVGMYIDNDYQIETKIEEFKETGKMTDGRV